MCIVFYTFECMLCLDEVFILYQHRYNPISTAAQLSSGHGSYVGYNGSNGIMDNSNGSQWQGGAYSNQVVC